MSPGGGISPCRPTLLEFLQPVIGRDLAVFTRATGISWLLSAVGVHRYENGAQQ